MIKYIENVSNLYNNETGEIYPLVEFGECDLFLSVPYSETGILGTTEITVMTYRVPYDILAEKLKPYLE